MTEEFNEQIDQDGVVRRLQAITRQITCMSKDRFNVCFKDADFDTRFDHYCWNESAKIQIRIVMTKIKLDEDKREDEVVLSPVLKMISGFTCPKCACTYADCQCLYDAVCKICSNYKVACVCEEVE